MRRVLIIAYYTPPLAMGGVQRVTKLAKYLKRFGWEPVLLTVKPIAYYAYDHTLLDDLRDIPIYRAASLDPARLLRLISKKAIPAGTKPEGIFGRAVRFFLPVDSKSPWVPFAYQLGKRIVRSYDPDLIFSTAPPLSAHLVGLLLKKKFNLPLILDFRDPYLNLITPTPLHRSIQEKAFEWAKRSADGFVSVTAKFAEALGIKAVVIENGFDPADFTVEPQKKDARFTIGYMGAFIEREESLISFIQALQRIPGVVLKIAGYVNPSLIAQFGNTVEYCGYLSHRAAIAFIKSCDLLWLTTIERPALPPSMTGKLFEYMATGKPILATVRGENEITQYLRQYRLGIAVPPEPEAIYQAIFAFKAGKLAVKPESISRFSRLYQASVLADFFTLTVENRTMKNQSFFPKFSRNP